MSDKIKIVISDEQKSVKVPKGIRMIVRRSCLAALQMENIGGPCVINVTFTDNAKIKELKQKRTGKGVEAGAVWMPESGGEAMGTIYISMEKAQELAEFYDCSLQKEVCYLTVHEALHMIESQKHSQNSELKIQEKKETVMYQLGLPLSAGYALSNT